MTRISSRAVRLEQLQECQGQGCGCFTRQGWYVRRRSRSCETVLFLCQDCYRAQFPQGCRRGRFREADWGRPQGVPIPSDRCRRFRARTVRGLLTAILSLLTAISLLTGQPRCQVPPPIHVSVHIQTTDFAEVRRQLERAAAQIEFLLRGGSLP